MGMFDWVDFETKCPICGEKVTGFQSQDGECSFATLKVTDVRSFYSSCDACDTWIEFVKEKCGCNKYERIIEPEGQKPQGEIVEIELGGEEDQ